VIAVGFHPEVLWTDWGLVWDNRSLIHHASYTATPEPVVSVYDG